ncbi:NAD(P)-binding protein [Coemansia reversa NRRL 1564]|uniref:NAD(P)-binding protein n=1 Tax=Coemansia reversa (strain ATCC 12441 / NRRL 1564) TaxID=763665 RepID=A0A2G5B8E3_COERN|nr:NAD(P)-binding protein [Coemansia reversa NRRL 1564]|eukprot:PIA15260.1 NAD(P)-binding protein [Coemansia reversa NRRL 1564]
MINTSALPVNHIYAVTGATGDLGQAIVRTLANRGETANEQRHIVLVGRNHPALESVSAAAANTYTRTYIVSDCEATAPAEKVTRSIIAQVEDVARVVSGPLKLTLIDCVGFLGDLSKTVDQYSADEIAVYIGVNFTFFCTLTAKFLAFAKATQAERITMVNISSLLAIQPSAYFGLYSSTKAARDQLLKIVALEHKDDSRVKALSYAPGPLDNHMQLQIRTTVGDIDQQTIYQTLHNEDKLVRSDTTAGLMCTLLDEWTFKSGAHIDIYDIISPPS